jgi:hypothetical protein
VGRELARLHLDCVKLEPYPLKWLETEGVPLSYEVEDKVRLSKDETALHVNPSSTVAGARYSFFFSYSCLTSLPLNSNVTP